MTRKQSDEVRLVEASPARDVLDLPIPRVVIEPGTIRFPKNGRGRGLTLPDDAS